MTFRTAAACLAVSAALVTAPLASASARDHWHHGGDGGGVIFGLGAAVGALAVGIVTLPFAIIGGAANALAGPTYAPAPAYAPGPAYAPAPAYGNAPQPGYGPPPVAYYPPPPAYTRPQVVYYPPPGYGYPPPPGYYYPAR